MTMSAFNIRRTAMACRRLDAGPARQSGAQPGDPGRSADWRFEGPAALFAPVASGHFKAEKLDVTIDGNGSGGTVTRVAWAPTTWASPTWPR